MNLLYYTWTRNLDKEERAKLDSALYEPLLGKKTLNDILDASDDIGGTDNSDE